MNYTFEYVPFRGINKHTLEFYDVKAKIADDGTPIEIGFRYPSGLHQIRSLTSKDFRWETKPGLSHKPGLFGRDKFSAGCSKSVTITEGAIDALSYRQVLRSSPVCSVQSSSSAVRDCVADFEWLNSFERVYIAFDNDTPGHDAASAVARLFDFNKVYQVKYDKYKDANDFLQHGEEEALLNLWHNARRYLPSTVISSFSEFEKALEEQPQVGIPYPFDGLNKKTLGMRTGESVLITAQEGVGKTEMMHAIEYQLLEQTNDNVGAIYLEEPKSQHLKALAGIALEKPAHLPGVCSKDEIIKAVRACVNTDERLHLYSHFGSSDPEVLLDTIRFLVVARSCRWILLDHISMVVSALVGEDERKALDYISTRLEMMLKELDFGLILVSHVNDLGQTRGSRWISKVADVRIDLKRDVASGSNIVELIISKPSRFTGQSGHAGSYVFDQYTRRYTSLEPANDNEEAENGGHKDAA